MACAAWGSGVVGAEAGVGGSSAEAMEAAAKGAAAEFLRMLRLAAGAAGAATDDDDAPAEATRGRSATERPPGTGPVLVPSKALTVGL